jgi:dTDP-glucose 4,6-dehydratase
VKILVTGGLGVLGTALIPELERNGHDVWCCDLPHSHGAKYSRCDVRSYRELRALIATGGFDYVYHLAAEFGRHNGEDHYESLWTTNAIGTKNIVRLQEEFGFRLIFFSSSEVYGDYEGTMSEEVMDQVPIRQLNDYAASKWVGELQVLNSEAVHGTETVRVRLFNIYGPGEFYSPYRSALCVFAYSAVMGLPYKVFLGHHRTSLYVADAVRTLAAIVERFRAGRVYNIAGDERHDMKIVSDMILAEAGRTDDLVDYVDQEPMTTRDKKVDASRAVKELGHAPTVSLQEGLPRLVHWMRSVYGTNPTA